MPMLEGGFQGIVVKNIYSNTRRLFCAMEKKAKRERRREKKEKMSRATEGQNRMFHPLLLSKTNAIRPNIITIKGNFLEAGLY